MARPSSYKPEYAIQLLKLCKFGATDLEIANFFNVSIQTIYTWQVNYPEFLDALKTGKDAFDNRIIRSLAQRAMGYSVMAQKVTKDGDVVDYREEYPPDTLACIFWLKNRKRADWNDKQDIVIDWQGLQLFQINYNGNGKPELPTGSAVKEIAGGSTEASGAAQGDKKTKDD
jgi:hypothetical protein